MPLDGDRSLTQQRTSVPDVIPPQYRQPVRATLAPAEMLDHVSLCTGIQLVIEVQT
jgi:hypothetical protein